MRAALRRVLLLSAILVLPACSLQPGWGEDHTALDELPVLEESDLWVELFSLPTETANCDLANCQNVVGGRTYKVLGDVDEARSAAVSDVIRNWVPTGDVDVSAPSIDFQLRDGVETNTLSGTAFLTVYFFEDREIWPEGLVDDAIAVTYTSDRDPDWMLDTVLTSENFTPLGVALTTAGLCLAVCAFVVGRRRRQRAHTRQPVGVPR